MRVLGLIERISELLFEVVMRGLQTRRFLSKSFFTAYFLE